MPALQPEDAWNLQLGDDSRPGPFTVSFETGRHYKVHKSYIWLGPAIAVLAVLIVGVANSAPAIVSAFSAIHEKVDAPILLMILGSIGGLALLYGIMTGLYALGYKNMSYVFDEREFSFYSGIITKRRVHLPYTRVQSVNHRATIVQRIAGVCTVTIDSAGGSSNKALRVPFLRLETAERMRIDLFVRKAAVEAGVEGSVVYDPSADPASAAGAYAESEHVRRTRSAPPVAPGVPVPGGQPDGRTAVPTRDARPNALDAAGGVVGQWRGVYGGAVAGLEPASFEFGLTNRELLLTSASHSAPTGIALVMGLTMAVLAASLALSADDAARLVVTMSIPIVLGAALVSWLVGVVGMAVSYGNYRARRRGSHIEVERGLLQRNFSGIDIARVQSIEIRQSMIRRLMGYCEVSLGRINAGGDEAGKQNSSSATRGLVVHPFVKLDRVDEVIDGLVPELADRPRVEDLAMLPAPALRRSILRRCVWYNGGLYLLIGLGVSVAVVNGTPGGIPAVAAQGFYGMVGLLAACCIVYTVGRAVGAVFWARESGYAWNRNYLMLRNSGLAVSCSVVPRQKIQSGSTRDNPFQRRLALTGISAMTAAGTRSTLATLIDVPAEVGAAYLEWLKPRR